MTMFRESSVGSGETPMNAGPIYSDPHRQVSGGPRIPPVTQRCFTNVVGSLHD
ncbi:hypothetical protein HAX54_038637, partial [Datura stramonium]|nr:hypothetical protein [Datura stramonium]